MVAARAAAGQVDFAAVQALRSQVAERLTAQRSARVREGFAPLSDADEQRLAQSLIASAVDALASAQAAHDATVPDGALDGRLAAAVEAAMFGAGPLQALLEDPDVENVDINGVDEMWVTYASGERVRLAVPVESDADLIDVLRGLASHVGAVARPWSTVHPQLDLGLPGGVRISGLLAASARPQVSIRRDRLGPQAFLDEVPRRYGEGLSLVELGTLDRQCAAFLAAAVRAKANIVIAGATNAGKTTLLRALVNVIPPQERLITIEQALELRLGRDSDLHANVVELETVLPSPEGLGGLDGADLVRRSKRMNPDRLIFGEVLHGPEARAMLEAMLQGGDGSMSTIHSRDAYGAVARLVIGLGSLREPVQPVTAAALIGQAVDFIVHIAKTGDGRRVITEIIEVSGHQGEIVSSAKIFATPTVSALDPAMSVPDAMPATAGVESLLEAAGRQEENAPALTARRDSRIPIRRADLLAQHGYTDQLGEWLNTTEPQRRRPRDRGRSPLPGSAAALRQHIQSQTGGPDLPGADGQIGPRRGVGQAAGQVPSAGGAVAGASDPAGIPDLGMDFPAGPDVPVAQQAAAAEAVRGDEARDGAWHQVILPEDREGPRAPRPPREPAASFVLAHTPEPDPDEPAAPAGAVPAHAGPQDASWEAARSGPIIDLQARRRESPAVMPADDRMPLDAPGQVPVSGSSSPASSRRQALVRERSGTPSLSPSGGSDARPGARTDERPRGAVQLAVADERAGVGEDMDQGDVGRQPEWKRIGPPTSSRIPVIGEGRDRW
ncbi:CpaF family protein [Kineosporia sp. J2-2]|uniref:CpaF family protein n=1 Tax=Kineosporia corallincola TaxID=2835133 RepID=A0ABS5TTS2_9ACTN|nr:ATPase, T2SS/T4P/T4SS family [Kineosporia corallincola]MBT0774207.1 CpaF family protein [Kineosporia corallincola]